MHSMTWSAQRIRTDELEPSDKHCLDVFRSPAGGKMKRHTQQVVANVIGLRITLDLELSFTSMDV